MEKITHIVFDHDGTLVDTCVLPRMLYPGLRELLSFLKEKNVFLYVWTSRSNKSTRSSLEELDVMSHFDGVYGGDDGPGKPAPDGISVLLPEVNPQNVIVIGDSIGDIIGGKKFGASCIGAMWGHGDASASSIYKEYGASESFLTVNELKQYLEDKI